jgi:hypothetical protein
MRSAAVRSNLLVPRCARSWTFARPRTTSASPPTRSTNTPPRALCPPSSWATAGASSAPAWTSGWTARATSTPPTPKLDPREEAGTAGVLMTNIRVDSMLAGSLELEGIAELSRAFPGFSTIHLPSLHAKVFVADSKRAIVTSGNLTDGGLRRNCEYGVSIHAPKLVREVRQDFEDYAHLGAPMSIEEIGGFAVDLAGLRATYQAQNHKLVREVGAKLKSGIQAAEDRVLQLRARSGTTQGIFRKTILYLLAKSALKTAELHPLIQQIHPDLCDDNIDRVIDGMNFGKKWKHHVRSAQQALKREGKIVFDGERWSLSMA